MPVHDIGFRRYQADEQIAVAGTAGASAHARARMPVPSGYVPMKS
ncbi:MAG TPA: hypothetical protein VG142_18800 [Trebonia sp.]|jgi:hypothetical protein|nr:hypothetical protein [Trebonia sp.]